VRIREFRNAVREAILHLPGEIRAAMDNLVVTVEDLPSRETMAKVGVKDPYDLLGLYEGVPLERRGFFYGNVLPDRIVLFRKSILARCRQKDEVVELVRKVLLHEVGHFLGLEEDDLRKMDL
jgi:predicted Zn-dependent protease with MMP-like domain